MTAARIRIALWAHSLASWAALGALWIFTLLQPHRPPLDSKFWLVFAVTEGLAPVWLPLSIFLYFSHLDFDLDTAIVAATYLATFLIVATWRRRCEMRKLERARKSALLCVRCGYDLRATPGRCPECGLESANHPAGSQAEVPETPA
jgi:uncharacterized membrane protein